MEPQTEASTVLIKYLIRQPGDERWIRYYEEVDQEVWESPASTAMINTRLKRKHPGCEVGMFTRVSTTNIYKDVSMKITVAAVRVIIFTFGLAWFFIAAAILILLHDKAGWGDLELIGTGILLWGMGMGGFYLILRYLKSKA